ncbi:hypothetical protein GCM10010524_46870 [Streptomyces mexicanus]
MENRLRESARPAYRMAHVRGSRATTPDTPVHLTDKTADSGHSNNGGTSHGRPRRT